MAKVVAPLLSAEASGKFGRGMVFVRGKQGAIVRRPRSKEPLPNEGQVERRNFFISGKETWKALDLLGKEYLNNLAAPLKITGYDFFMRQWLRSGALPVAIGNVLDNGYFSGSSDPWILGAGWSWSEGQLNQIGIGFAVAEQDCPAITEGIYELTVQLSGVGQFYVAVNGNLVLQVEAAENETTGTVLYAAPVEVPNVQLYGPNESAFVGLVDSVVLQKAQFS